MKYRVYDARNLTYVCACKAILKVTVHFLLITASYNASEAS